MEQPFPILSPRMKKIIMHAAIIAAVAAALHSREETEQPPDLPPSPTINVSR